MKDVAWLDPDGREMNDEAWNADFVRSLGMLLAGNAIEEVDEHGEPIVGDTLLVLLNAHSEDVPFTLPALEADQQWLRVVRHGRSEGARAPVQARADAIRCRAARSPCSRCTPPLRDRRRAGRQPNDRIQSACRRAESRGSRCGVEG